ncbi:MAG: AAA family ATPase, partial [Gammaproteobacteria bacterium]|nr:AAA family ATPase [Gammaproteobacteria bacterium]
MPIQRFSVKDFRCLANIEFEADPRYNLIYGANASGKTSVLEALGYLGRGKSFRGAPTTNLIRHGQREFVLFGRVEAGGRHSSVGVRNSSNGLEVRIDGQSDGGAAALAAALPLQIVDPDVH